MKVPQLPSKFAVWRCRTSLLLFLSVAALWSGVSPSSVCAQGSIPAIRGLYQGTGADNRSACADPSQGPVSVRITNQVNDNFNGLIDVGFNIFLSGTVDASGALQGTYDYDELGLPGSGTFTGQFNGSVVPKTLDLTLTGTFTIVGVQTCNETLTITATLLTAGGPSADLSITGTASPTPVSTGKTITYNLTVANAGPNDATDTLASNPAPAGASIVGATSSQGACSVRPGAASCSLGTVPNGGTVSVTITANVFAAPGSTLISSPGVSSSVFDPNFSNNSTTSSTPVEGGALVKLNWSQPQSTGGSSTPAPSGLQVQPGGASSSTSGSASSSAFAARSSSDSAIASTSQSTSIAPMDSCSRINVNVYKSDQPGVQPTQENLFSRLPGDALEAIVPIAPPGSSYVVSNLWLCGASTMESSVSNEVDVPSGPTITGLKVTGKLKIFGSGFSGQVQVFVDGVPFVRAVVVADSTLLIQKGSQSDGTSIADIGTTRAVLVTVKNGDGGFASFTFKRP